MQCSVNFVINSVGVGEVEKMHYSHTCLVVFAAGS